MSEIMKNTDTRISIILVLLLVAIYPLSGLLPGWTSFENGPIENAQVVVLLLFAFMCFQYYRNLAVPHRKMWLPAGVVFLILAGRELSWGRVFFTTGYDPESGPLIIAASEMPFHTEIHAFVGVLSVLCLAGLIRWVPWRQVLRHIPWGNLLLIGICITLVTLGDHHVIFYTIRDQLIEEMAELLLYVTLGATARYYRHQIKE